MAIRAISISANGPAVVITIEGTGALPSPLSGVPEGSPRIFFDFPGVALQAPSVTASRDPRVRRIRAAVNSARPLVTRVVLDLMAALPYRVEAAAGRVRVIVGETERQSARGVAPVPPLPDPPMPEQASRELTRPAPTEPALAVSSASRAPVASSAPPPSPAAPPADAVAPPAPPPLERPRARGASSALVPSRASPSTTSPPPPGRDQERYRRLLSPALDRLRLQEPLLASLGGADDQTADRVQLAVDRVQLAVEEFERLRQELAALRPPDSLRSQHDMFLQSTILALMATRLWLEGFRTLDPATLRNAASAAAGATLLLDRACSDLGCPGAGR